ncbi:hypothetical protein LCP963914a_5204 [Penicillium roqueforti]|nr:hypothetical protein LCP963914a_5204 [Penicillium roqueforti]
MNTTPQQILNIEDALVSEANPARLNGPLDYERCARLHNYLVAYGWMARHGQETPNLDVLASQPFIFADEDTQAVRERLHPSVNSFLDSIFSPEPGFFYWINDISMQLVDNIFLGEDNDLDDLERFVIIYGTVLELGSHCVGVVYDQQLHRAAFPMTLENLDSVEPIGEHEDMWFPLETILTHWIYMLRIGKITTDSPEGEAPKELANSRSQIGLWSWLPYCPSQVDSTVAAIDRYSAAIEARMPSGSLLPVSRDAPLFTDVELDAASIPEECFIRLVLTRMRTPRFRAIAPGLEVPHDTMAFTARQRFTGVPREQEEWGNNIPPVLIFAAADSSHTVGFGEEIRWLFFAPGDEIPFDENDLIPTGLYTPFTAAEAAIANKRAFEVLRILRRADNNCPSGYNPCTDLGNGDACCKQGTNCSRDAANNIACCASGASCTGSLTGTTTTGTGTAFMFPSGATATTTTEGETSATGSTLDAAYPFVVVPTSFGNAESCSSYYSVCQSEYTQCTGALMGRYGVTIDGAGGGVTVEAVTASSQATSICSSLSLEACHGINLGYCSSVATQTASAEANGNDASPVRMSSLHDLVFGLAVGVAGMFI